MMPKWRHYILWFPWQRRTLQDGETARGFVQLKRRRLNGEYEYRHLNKEEEEESAYIQMS